MKENMQELVKYLPEGWEAKAKELGALQRGRKIKTATELLTAILVYLMCAGSHGITASMLSLEGREPISKTAVYKRIRQSWKWLQWMVVQMCAANEFSIEKPEWLDRKVIAIDASDVALSGSRTSDYRLHCAFDLFGLTYRTIEITPISQGEKLSRHMMQRGDIVLADRVYGTITGISYVRESGADFIVRYRTKGFKLSDKQGRPIQLLEELNGLKPKESKSIHGYYTSEGKKYPVRMVAQRKDPSATEQAHRKMERTAKRKNRKPPSQEALALNEYIILATSLDESDGRILELYRARWQIEEVFNRLKTLYAFGEVPSKQEDAVHAWFYGKLFLAVLSESILKQECFFP